MKIFGFIKGIFKPVSKYIEGRRQTKELQLKQRHEIIKAETDAIVNRITSNTQSDNEIDLITARNKRFTSKDEIVTYLFLVPVFVASAVPFITAYNTGQWIELNQYVRDSYEALDLLPTWYKYVLFGVIIDVLGFRSFARKIIDSKLGNKSGITIKK